ncbi:MAG: homoserine kinase [Pseudomonadota bacterium]
MTESVTAFAPASIGNLAVGFDMLGAALTGVGDRVTARRTDEPGISVDGVFGLDGKPHPYLATDPDHNTASIAAKALWNDYGDSHGVALSIYKGVPLQSGMGSSAASAVAATVAVNEFVSTPLPVANLLAYALTGEQYASGGLHADNVAPSLMGGMVYCPQVLLPKAYHVPAPQGVSAVLVHPEMQVNTAHARAKLAKSYSTEQWLTQQGYLGGFMLACATNDIDLIRDTLKDVIIEPQRSAAVPCFEAVKDAAERKGALGFSLSGSGPSLFALVEEVGAKSMATAMEQACRSMGYDCQSYITRLDAPGAHIEAD